MKKIGITCLTLALLLSLGACGMNDPSTTTKATTMPHATTPATSHATTPSTKPSTNPTDYTNIPDPSVDTSMPRMTDSTENTTKR